MSASHLQLPSPVARLRPPGALLLYASFLAVVASLATVALVVAGAPLSHHGDAWPLLLFALFALLVEHESIPISPRTEVSVSYLPLLFVAVVFGPLGAVFVGGVAMLTAFPWAPLVGRTGDYVDKPFLRYVVWTSNRVIVAAIGGVVSWAVVGNASSVRIVLATAGALMAMTVTDLALTALTLRVRGTEKALDALKAVGKVSAAGAPIYGAVAALLAYTYIAVTPLTAALFFVPALAFQRLLTLTRKQQEALTSLESVNQRLEKANLSFATALVATLDARDRYTAGHSEAVAMYGRDIAAEFGWSSKDQQLVDLCGLVHDIGKIGLPPGLLEKPGALNPEERLQMEEHSAIGERILANVEDYSEIAVIVRHHHERWDGGGYPDGLAGDAIPLISRVLAVADAYDAMTSHRPYRAALPSAEARRRLRESAGSQFDRDVVEAFEAVLERAHPKYLAGRAGPEPEDDPRRERAVALAS